MRFRFLTIVLCLWAFTLCSFAHPQEPPQDKLLLIEGRTETAVGCPVTLSEARYQRLKVITPQDGLTEAVNQVKIENVSGRAIRKVYILFRHDGKDGGMMGSGVTTKSINAGETLFSRHPYRIGTGDKTVVGYEGVFTAFAEAVEFEDDTHWVTPRRVDFPMMQQALNSQPSPLVVRKCDDIDTGYRAILMTNSNLVVAYRLGVVKDTPNSFEVRVGEWITMPEASTPNRAEIKIAATDPTVSLPQSWLFKREKSRHSEFSGSFHAGVALFVAEVKLADGTIWKQNLTRDELIWGLYN